MLNCLTQADISLIMWEGNVFLATEEGGVAYFGFLYHELLFSLLYLKKIYIYL